MQIEKVKKLLADLHDITAYIIHNKKFKTSINSWISFKKSSYLNKFNQNLWLKLYIDMNADLRK